MIVAPGTLPAMTRLTAVLARWLGAAPKLHCNIAPVVLGSASGSLLCSNGTIVAHHPSRAGQVARARRRRGGAAMDRGERRLHRSDRDGGALQRHPGRTARGNRTDRKAAGRTRRTALSGPTLCSHARLFDADRPSFRRRGVGYGCGHPFDKASCIQSIDF
jgi:hypothetical protein